MSKMPPSDQQLRNDDPCMKRFSHWPVSLMLVASLSATGVFAATLSGTVVTSDQRPIAGAMVTAFNEPGDRKETVFTGADGRYALRTSFAGKLTLRART